MKEKVNIKIFLLTKIMFVFQKVDLRGSKHGWGTKKDNFLKYQMESFI